MGDRVNRSTLTLVRFAERCVDVQCGYYHTLLLSAKKQVWVIGSNDYGQIGNGGAGAQGSVNLPTLNDVVR